MMICENKCKKNLKKIHKIKLKLSDKNKVVWTDEPSSIIVVANGGLGNAVKRSELENALKMFSSDIEDIITPPSEPFSVLLVKDSSCATNIVSKMEELIIFTPNFKKRPEVLAYLIMAKSVSEDILRTVDNFLDILPTGLNVKYNFIDVSEELELIDYFLHLNKDNLNQMKKRTVLHFGYEFNYTNNRVDVNNPLSDNPIPENCKEILKRLETECGRPYLSFDQLTVNIYEPGNGIPPHVDTHSVFTDEIISVSLGSDIIMEFYNPDTNVTTNVDLKSRSVCIMSGESRYLWHHGIAARKTDLILCKEFGTLTRRQRSLRISLTFRKVKIIPQCRCKWLQSCDISDRSNMTEIENPSKLEDEFVHKVYEEIADHFSSTRHSMWPKVRNFICEQSSGSIGADIGCGNGKYFPAILQRGFLLGSDMSFNLCKIAYDAHRVDVLQSNCIQLPYRDGCCDYFISIAVLHHLSTDQRRYEGILKMSKLLRCGGKGLIYVWAKDQKNSGVNSHYINVKQTQHQPLTLSETESPLPVHVNRTEFVSTDMLVPWCKKSDTSASSKVFTRYYHLFMEGELELLCERVPNVKVVQSWHDSGNWAVVIQKL